MSFFFMVENSLFWNKNNKYTNTQNVNQKIYHLMIFHVRTKCNKKNAIFFTNVITT
jgi:hypothetical protein